MYKKISKARGVQQAYEELLSAKLRDRVPSWLHAMRSVPPADSLVRDPTQFSTSGTLEFEGKKQATAGPGKSALATQIRRKLPEGCVSIKHGKNSLRTRSTRPPKIEFPEDKLRRVFYKNHPFELMRPRIVMEHSGKTNADWGTLLNGSSHVTGESVIRYQYFLMQTEGMTEQEAYVQATSGFYKIRAREEMESKIAHQEARAYGAQMLEKPFSANQLKMEKKQMQRSGKAFKLRQEERRLRNVTSEKMFAASGETA
ncbi:mitochondrial ribosomal small subunit component [Coemansia sp. Benny D115]|nr:mitochondrial ribosomal small subunit component [Coemansia sp. Benny D115]